MSPSRLLVVAVLAAPSLLHAKTKYAPKYSIDEFLSPPSPLEVGAAKKADKLAWVTCEKGLRNIYVASAPDFTAKRITKFLADDGVDLGAIRLSDDGSLATFVRGHGQNRDGWVAHPSGDPDGGERAIWAAKTDGRGAWRLASIATTPGRIGIRGLSYGGILTAEALARNSDVFVAGVSLLRAKGVYYGLRVTPDHVHESLIQSRWIDIFSRSSDFHDRFVWMKEAPPPVAASAGRRGG